jgi:hypothetical protein
MDIWGIANCWDSKAEVIQSRSYTEMMIRHSICIQNVFSCFGSRAYKTECPQDRPPAKNYSYFVYNIVLTAELTQLQMKWVSCKDLKSKEDKAKLS